MKRCWKMNWSLGEEIMVYKVRSKILTDRILKFLMVMFVLLSLGLVGGAAASPVAQAGVQTEPQAGTWKTWVLTSGSQFRLPTPPDQAATADEIAQLKQMAGKRDDAALQQIAYWNAGPPAYRWN